MTTANKITIIRILMIPIFIICALYPQSITSNGSLSSGTLIVSLILFCVASFTDFLDGYIARKYNQVTDFGKFVDPLADKLLVTAALLIFIEWGMMASWMVFIILAREFIITSLRIVAANKGRVLAATWTGKVKTCVQIAGIIILFGCKITISRIPSLTASSAEPTIAFILISASTWIMTIVTLYSGFDYLRKNWDLIKDGAVK